MKVPRIVFVKMERVEAKVIKAIQEAADTRRPEVRPMALIARGGGR